VFEQTSFHILGVFCAEFNGSIALQDLLLAKLSFRCSRPGRALSGARRLFTRRGPIAFRREQARDNQQRQNCKNEYDRMAI
jgi:hypothetical protein